MREHIVILQNSIVLSAKKGFYQAGNHKRHQLKCLALITKPNFIKDIKEIKMEHEEYASDELLLSNQARI